MTTRDGLCPLCSNDVFKGWLGRGAPFNSSAGTYTHHVRTCVVNYVKRKGPLIFDEEAEVWMCPDAVCRRNHRHFEHAFEMLNHLVAVHSIKLGRIGNAGSNSGGNSGSSAAKGSVASVLNLHDLGFKDEEAFEVFGYGSSKRKAGEEEAEEKEEEEEEEEAVRPGPRKQARKQRRRLATSSDSE